MGSLGIVPNLGQIYNPDSFTGNGSNTTFTLTHLVTSDQSIIWVEGGVVQKPGIDFTVSGLTLTRTTAPANLVACFAMYLGVSMDIGVPSDGTVTLAKMAVNSVDSDQYVDGSIDNEHIADDAINSEHYAAGSIDTAHIATNQIDETLMKDAFVGDFSDVTVTAADAFLYGDSTDGGNTKKDTVQGILDLAGGGKVLQVISEELGKYNQTSTSTTIDYMIKDDDSDWALAITPASTSNYLMITLTAGVAYTASGAQNRYIVSPFANIGGGGFTQLFSNSFMGCYQAGDVLNTQFENLYTNIIKYSPSTTSEVTIKIGYKVFYSGNGATLRMNPQSGTETVLTVMEIEG